MKLLHRLAWALTFLGLVVVLGAVVFYRGDGAALRWWAAGGVQAARG